MAGTNGPDSKAYGANMGSTWGRQDPGGPHVGHMNIAIWVDQWEGIILRGFSEAWPKMFLVENSQTNDFTRFDMNQISSLARNL